MTLECARIGGINLAQGVFDTAHGFAHKDKMKAGGEIIKQPLFFETHNLAFTYATIDLKVNWKKSLERFNKGDE